MCYRLRGWIVLNIFVAFISLRFLLWKLTKPFQDYKSNILMTRRWLNPCHQHTCYWFMLHENSGLQWRFWSTLVGVLACCPLSQSPLQWRHNEHDGVSNHQPCDCLLNRLFGRRSKKTSKLRVTGLGDRWIPRTKGQLHGKCFHLMTSSCHCLV